MKLYLQTISVAMHSRRWVWALHFGLVGITFATTLDDKEAPDGETVNGGILPDFPISLPPIHVPSPGFGGLDNTPALGLQKRDAPEPKCGPTYGPCQDGYCCSPSGMSGARLDI